LADKNSSEVDKLKKTTEAQANEITFLKNEIKKLGDPNAEPRIIQRGNQVHPKYERNKIKIPATLPKENPTPTKK